MSTKETGGPAFSCAENGAHNIAMAAMLALPDTASADEKDKAYIEAKGKAMHGMTLRDYFAAKALPIAAGQFSRFVDDAAPELGVYLSPDGYEHAARAAYSLADAMLAARGAQ